MHRRVKPIRRQLRRPLVGIEQLEDRTTPVVAFALSGSSLLTFDTASPTITQSTTITGVDGSESLVGIDFRPQNGQLYGLGVNAAVDTATLYTISTRTGVATPIGAVGQIQFTTDGSTIVDLPDPGSFGYGFDVNPAVDRIRVVAGTLNFRINPNTGAPIDGDNGGGVTPGINPDGPIGGGSATVDETAYTNNQPQYVATPITTQYTVDSVTNQLQIQNPPNSGTQTLGQVITLGGNELDFSAVIGFDIPAGVDAPASNSPVTTGSGFAVLQVDGTTGLYSIDLATAQATFIGKVGDGSAIVRGLSIQNDYGGIPVIALNADATDIVRFNTADPGNAITKSLTGLVSGETLVGIDIRPQTGQLYGLGIDSTANTGTIYLIDPQTAAATAIAAGAIAYVDDSGDPVDLPDPTIAGYGFDFNPTVDRIRITTSTGLNARANPNNGLPLDGNTGIAGIQPDGFINGGPTGVSGTAYTNAFGRDLTLGSGKITTQYTIDEVTGTLNVQNPPNNGAQSQSMPITLGGDPLVFTAVNGFDIPAGVRVAASNDLAGGFGYATLVVGGVSKVYTIDLSTGAANLVGDAPTLLNGLTLADSPAGTVSFDTTTLKVAENDAAAILTLTRSSGTVGSINVTVSVTGGTASAGSDFVAGPYTATFGDGETTTTVSIPLLDDTIFEGSETFILTITATDNAAVIGAPNSATVTILENDPQQSFTVNAAVGYALVGSSLVPFASSNPGAAGSPIAIVGVDVDETLVAIDFRPQNGQLYGLGVNSVSNTATLYLISTVTGTATPVGTVGAISFVDAVGDPIVLLNPALVDYDIDFNPAVDRLRILAGSFNGRVDPNTGLPIDGNANAAGVQPDGAINGGTSTVGGTAYTNAFPNNGATTTQYTLDAETDSLYIQNPPNNGTQSSGIVITLDGAPLDFTNVRGFDILANVNAPASNAAVTNGTGLAVLTVGGVDGLYSINLVTGEAAFIGTIGTTPATVQSVAFQSDLGATPVIALNATGTALVRALTTTISTPFVVTISGVVAGETLVGIDFRPQTGQLFGLGIDGINNTGTIYRIDPQTGAATAIAPSAIAYVDSNGDPVSLGDPSTTGFGFDFNPTVDRIRITNSLGLNARANPNNGLPLDGDTTAAGIQPDGAINGAATGVSATAYTNAFGQSLSGGVTTQYTLDATTDSLYIQNPPNKGTQVSGLPITLAGSPLDFTDVNGFNIPSTVRVATSATPVSSGIGIAALTVGGVSSLYSINLATGEATLLGDAPFELSGLTTANTPAGIVEFATNAISVDEEAGTANLTLVRTGGTSGELTVTLVLTNGTAIGGVDFDAAPITVTFVDGQTTALVSVPIIADTIFETDETFTISIQNGMNDFVIGATTSAEITILNNDDPPVFNIDSVSGPEGDLVFTVTLVGQSEVEASVVLNTVDGTAIAGKDYTALTGLTLTFAPGVTSQTVTVNVNDDGIFELDESFSVVLSDATNATIGTDTGLATIENNDAAPVFSIDSVSGPESGDLTFTVTLVGQTEVDASVVLDTVDGTAIAGKDYTAISGLTLTFAAGVTSQTVTVTVNNDGVFEADETFTLVLSDASNATIGTDTGTGTIVNDDDAPSFSINDIAVVEGNSGTKTLTFTITLTGATELPASVTVATMDKTAMAGSDYVALASKTITFNPGETTTTVSITINGDTDIENDETFIVQLSNPVNATIARDQGFGTIVNDDVAPPQNPLLVGTTTTAYGTAGAPPVVRVVDANGTQISSTNLNDQFNGGVRTAVGDVDGDGIDDIIVGSGPGGPSIVRVISGKDGSELFSVAPFESTFTGGVFVAAGDLNGDGKAEIVISPDVGGGPRVQVYDGASFVKLADFFGIDDPNFRGGARVAIGDVNGDGVGDLVVAAGFQGGPRVSVIDGTTITTTRTTLFNDFFAFEETLRDGVYIAVGDINGDGFGDIVASGGPSGGPRVTVFDAKTLISSKGATLTPLANFFAGDPNSRTGVLVAVKDIDGDNLGDIRTVVGGSTMIRTYLGKNLSPTNANPTFTAEVGVPDFNGGVFVG